MKDEENRGLEKNRSLEMEAALSLAEMGDKRAFETLINRGQVKAIVKIGKPAVEPLIHFFEKKVAAERR